MSVVAIKLMNRNGTKVFKSVTQSLVRMTSTNEPCPPKQPEPSKPKEPCPPKAEPSLPPKTASSTCPNPVPCPPMPQCPPTICPDIPDSNNPCNYTPPPCPEPDEFNMSRIKRFQCLFQEENGIPIYLKRGTADALFYQTTLVLTIVGVIASVYELSKLAP